MERVYREHVILMPDENDTMFTVKAGDGGDAESFESYRLATAAIDNLVIKERAAAKGKLDLAAFRGLVDYAIAKTRKGGRNRPKT